jgi:hypothetical protein
VSSKRRPIAYSAQFAPGVFRSPEEVAGELQLLDEPEAPTDSRPAANVDTRLVRPTDDRPAGHPHERTNERPSERSNERTDAREREPRRRVRHSFDIWEDQLLALTEIQAQAFLTTRRKPKLGELVQAALDGYISAQRDTIERPNVRTNERTSRR